MLTFTYFILCNTLANIEFYTSMKYLNLIIQIIYGENYERIMEHTIRNLLLIIFVTQSSHKAMIAQLVAYTYATSRNVNSSPSAMS